jgi:acyl-CoA thioesterase
MAPTLPASRGSLPPEGAVPPWGGPAAGRPDQLARRVGETMWASDIASKDTMGMELVACEPGRAVLRMRVQELHLNGHRICHGGFIFTLADSTFAFACNSHNKVSVAAGASIEFLKPGQLGDVLTCEGVEQVLVGRHGIYDMRVTNQRGEVVAVFRGKSASIQGTVVPAEEP